MAQNERTTDSEKIISNLVEGLIGLKTPFGRRGSRSSPPARGLSSVCGARRSSSLNQQIVAPIDRRQWPKVTFNRTR